jgi:DNA adenine methylase
MDSETYYRFRAKAPGSLDAKERAIRFLYLNRYCFNGIYRTNAAGQFNVPYSGAKTGGFPAWEEFSKSVKLLTRAQVFVQDFEELLLEHVVGTDFVYLDPPYAVANRRVFRQYGPNSFGLYDLERLARALVEIDQRGAKFVLSYAYSREALTYFARWPRKKLFCQRNVAGFTGSRRLAAEIIFSNIS